MYLVIIFIFYFILISVLYTYLYIYLYLYIYSILIIFIIIYFVVLYHSILINIYINVSDVDFTFFRISKSINPRLSVLRLPSISNYFYKISDWFPKTFINENTMQQPIKPHISMFFSEISTLKSFPSKEIFYYTLKEIISHNRILAPVEALSNNFRKDFYYFGLDSLPALPIEFHQFQMTYYSKTSLFQSVINKIKEN